MRSSSCGLMPGGLVGCNGTVLTHLSGTTIAAIFRVYDNGLVTIARGLYKPLCCIGRGNNKPAKQAILSSIVNRDVILPFTVRAKLTPMPRTLPGAGLC